MKNIIKTLLVLSFILVAFSGCITMQELGDAMNSHQVQQSFWELGQVGNGGY